MVNFNSVKKIYNKIKNNKFLFFILFSLMSIFLAIAKTKIVYFSLSLFIIMELF